MRRVLESCKVEAGTKERYGGYASSGADVDHSRFVCGSGSLEKRGQEQFCEVERTWFAESAQNVHPLVDGKKFLTKGVGTPGHVIPVNGDLINRDPKYPTVSQCRFD